jgi:hypothetical protein
MSYKLTIQLFQDTLNQYPCARYFTVINFSSFRLFVILNETYRKEYNHF